MGKYLDKFRTTIPAIQGKQILQLVNGMKDSGAVRTVEEYTAKLQALTQHLSSTDPQPILKFFEAIPGERIDSDRFNAMIEAIGMDLETAFKEIEEIATALELHKSIYKLTVLQSLEKAIDDLEDTISLYEFLNRQIDRWYDAQYNTFNNVDAGRAKRDISGAGRLFYDYNRRETVTSHYDCVADVVGQQLILPTGSYEELKAVGVEMLDDADTAVPIRDTQHPTNSLLNIIDQKEHTYWLYPILSNAAAPATVKIRVDLGGVKEVNIIEIEPASPFPMILDSISYVGMDSAVNTVTLDTVLSKKTSISLGSISARYITFQITQLNYEQVLYSFKPKLDMWERANLGDLDPEQPDVDKIDRLAPELRTNILDEDLRARLGIASSDDLQEIKAYQSTIAIDNIRFYLNKFKSRGIFVGEQFNVPKPGIIGLQTTEDNPTVSIAGTEYPQFSFEYYIFKRDIDSAGATIDEQTFPILPSSYGNVIEHERLYLTRASGSSTKNVAVMRFTPSDTGTDPVVSKNLIDELVVGTDYEILAEGMDLVTEWVDNWADIFTHINDSSDWFVPMTIYIRFTEPSINSVYTVSYTASTRQSDATTALPRMINDYDCYLDNSSVRCEIEKDKATVDRSELHLIVLIRNNYISQTETAKLKDYKLLVATYDTEKLNG